MKPGVENPSFIEGEPLEQSPASWTRDQSHTLDLVIFLGVPSLLLGLALVNLPAEPTLIICGFRHLTGLPCPGCGTTRGLSALLHGELTQALRFNPLAVPSLLMLVIVWLRSVCVLAKWPWAVRRIESLYSWQHRRLLMWSLAAAVGVLWLWNLELYVGAKGFQAAMQEGWLYWLFHAISA